MGMDVMDDLAGVVRLGLRVVAIVGFGLLGAYFAWHMLTGAYPTWGWLIVLGFFGLAAIAPIVFRR